MITYDQLDGSPKQVKWAYSILKDFFDKLDLNNVTSDDLVCLGCTNAGLIIDNRELISQGASKAFVDQIEAKWIIPSKVDKYTTNLIEKYRSPAKGGNTSALHSHRIVIGDLEFFFKARGSKKWVYKSDDCVFAYYPDNGKNIILKNTLKAYDKNGNFVSRGDRRAKKNYELPTKDFLVPEERQEVESLTTK